MLYILKGIRNVYFFFQKSVCLPYLKFPEPLPETHLFFYSVLLNNLIYEGCSNMNASSFITFVTYMLRQNGKRPIKD